MNKEEIIEYLNTRIKDMDGLIDNLSAMAEAGVSDNTALIIQMLAVIADDIAHIYLYILTS
jgi:hypothetical protein